MKKTKQTIVAILTAILISTSVSAQVSTLPNDNILVKYIGSEEGYKYFEIAVPIGLTQNVFVKMKIEKKENYLAKAFLKTRAA